jgi:uncharacterized membrane protein
MNAKNTKNRSSKASAAASKKTSGQLSPDELTKRNIEVIKQLEDAARQQRTRSDLVAEAVARFCGSMTFVWVHILWFAVWLVLNTVPGITHIDPFPFTFLTLVVSLEAIFLSTFILISQNHERKLSERRNNLDLQINLLSEQENTRMIEMLRGIAEKVGCEIPNAREVRTLSETVDPQRVAALIEEGEQN